MMPSSDPHRKTRPLLPLACLASALVLAACGGGGTNSNSTTGGGSTVTNGGPLIGTLPTTASQLKLLAGNIGGPGYIDGPANVARFNGASALVVDSLGNTVVWDQTNSLLRKISTSGQVSTLAGHYIQNDPFSVCTNGQGNAANFLGIDAMAAGDNGDVYVHDRGCYEDGVRKITAGGLVSTVLRLETYYPGFGNVNFSYDIYRLRGVVFDRSSGNLFVTVDNRRVDTYLLAGSTPSLNYPNGLIYQVTPAGVATVIAGKPDVTGYADGPASSALFNQPTSIVANGAGMLYVTDCQNNAIRKIDKSGIVSTFVAASTGLVQCPSQLAIDASGNVVIENSVSGIVRVSPQGQVQSTQPASLLSHLHNVNYDDAIPMAADASGNLLFGSDTSVQLLSSSGTLSTFAGLDAIVGSADGVGSQAQFQNILSLAADQAGNLYAPDNRNATIRKISPTGVVTTFAGAAGQHGWTDGTGLAARFNSPQSVAMDPAGNLFVLDFLYSTPPPPAAMQSQWLVRKITPAGAVTTTYAGPVSPRQSQLWTISIDSSGTVYVLGDYEGPLRKSQILKLTSTGQLVPYMTLSGQAYDFAVDGQGNIYATIDNALRKTTPQGVETIIAGMPNNSLVKDGTGSDAGLGYATKIVMDASGSFFLADGQNSVVRRVTPQGVVTTYLGTLGTSGNALGTAPANLSPVGLAISGTSLYIATGGAVLLTGQ